MKKTIQQTTHEERRIAGGRRITLDFRADGETVPAILMLPETTQPAPAALMLHGYSSRKEDMADGIGPALLERGLASLSIDLPLHGTRYDPVQAQSMRTPLAIHRHWQTGIKDTRLALRYLAARPELDRERIAIVGYSMGSFLGVIAAADEPLVRALVLAAGGDLPSGTPFAGIARAIADPIRAVRKLAGRPLLISHGRRDRTVLPEQAQRLFDAAGEPKEIRWWDSGHYLPHAALDHAAHWLATYLGLAAEQRSA
jgi:fermentation-respiration switch protein FrsA (DUF1100 family)